MQGVTSVKYEEFLPLTGSEVHEIRRIFEVLNAEGELSAATLVSEAGKKQQHLEMYGQTRKKVVLREMEQFAISVGGGDINSNSNSNSNSSNNNLEIVKMARECVGVIEHALVVLSGEKLLFKCLTDQSTLTQTFSTVASAVIDFSITATEKVTNMDMNMFMQASTKTNTTTNTNANDTENPNVRSHGYHAAACMRILDAARFLFPVMFELTDSNESGSRRRRKSTRENNNSNNTINNNIMHLDTKTKTPASQLVLTFSITLHSSTLLSLTSLASSISSSSPTAIPVNCGIAALSSDVVKAIKMLCPFSDAYKVSERSRAGGGGG